MIIAGPRVSELLRGSGVSINHPSGGPVSYTIDVILLGLVDTDLEILGGTIVGV